MTVIFAVALVLALVVTAWTLNRERRRAEWDGFGRGLDSTRFYPEEGEADVLAGRWES